MVTRHSIGQVAICALVNSFFKISLNIWLFSLSFLATTSSPASTATSVMMYGFPDGDGVVRHTELASTFFYVKKSQQELHSAYAWISVRNKIFAVLVL